MKLLNESAANSNDGSVIVVISNSPPSHIMKSLPQISLVMASWLLKAIPPSFSRSFSLPSSLALPFCHLCSGTYRVATGFLFSGNVLDERKATWSNLRGTTCRRLIFQFSSVIFFPLLRFSSCGPGPEVQGEREDLGGLSPSSFCFDCQHPAVCSPCPCFLKWRNSGLGSHREKWRGGF